MAKERGKVCIVAPSFDEPNKKHEGRTKMIARLYRFLQESGIPVSTNLENCSIIHINSSGIFELIKYSKLPQERKIYSLYSNLKTNPLNVLRDTLDFLRIRNPEIRENSLKNIIIRTALTMAVCSTPTAFIRSLVEKTVSVAVFSNRYTARRIGARNGRVIRIGIDLRKFQECPKKRKRSITIGYVGHPSTSKGILEVVEIMKKLKGVRKVLFLSNPARIKAEKLTGTDGDIEVKGPQEDLKAMYSSIDVLILPYRHELSSIATPLVLLEAMACGVAVVTSSIEHLKEAGEDAVLYAEPGNVADFVKKVQYLIENPKVRKKLGRRAKHLVRKNYDERTMLQSYLNLYEEIGD
ncbi:glycosyltransferase family 4 protein [Thermococcus nautili]|uniref:Glycosyltransferase n=1 Tax=Thermococcus nautili TaxID=195522 RepID=W8P2D3_9EURY|nr:glycosyltransferase family 4 protein [Thermococcus nautili]AHL22941.1 Glycosyltransferase [Thermococcus nautili]CAI1492599.1 Glycosyltransferase [Thermococcus nautili]